MIEGLHHASITTRNLDPLVRFYCDLLGFEVALESAWSPGNAGAGAIFGLNESAIRMAMHKASNAFLELFEFQQPIGAAGDPNRPVCDHGYTHICLKVSDIGAEYDRLRTAGMRFHCPPQHAEGLCWAT